MPSHEIRILQAGEEAVLERIADEVFDDPIDPRAAVEFLADPRHHIAVALAEGVVVGFASGVHTIHPDKPHPEFWINEVGVSPAFQRRGLGKALMRALLARARELGCREAWVLTERDNSPAMRLYQSLSGEECEDDTVMFTFFLS
jgi:aminoglycoside 6'-N-acetyltransferase I